MSYPILYSATETEFGHNGLGILGDCVSCEVTEEANGIFELAMTYPMDGIHFEDIADRAIIKAKADQFRDPQLFRIYAISKPMSGIVTVLAEHISYDLSGIPVKPFSAASVSDALTGLKNNAVVDCPFEFWTDKETAANFSVFAPASIRSRLGGVAGSILNVYGGQYEFDNYTVKLHNSRGMNRGVSIRYGKNLTDIQQEQNCSNVATGVYPYWVDSEGNNLVELPEKIINAPGTYNFVKIRTLDLSSEFETQPTVEQLRNKTERYINANEIGVPRVSLTVSFAQLDQSDEYKHLKLLERVSLFDTVNVEFPALGVSATAKAVKAVYDVIADRVKSVTLGSVRANIADTIVEQQKEIEKKPSVSIMQSIITSLTSSILGAKGGSVRILDANGDGEPDTLYIADNPDPALAVKVWRFNYEGWGASKNGYNGPFTMGATLEDGLLANFVTAAHLIAGTVRSKDGKTFFADLDNGILKMQATEFSVSGKTVGEIAQEKADEAETAAKAYTDAQIKLTAEEISLSVNETYATKDEIGSEFDNIRQTVETYRTALELADKQIQSTVENTYATKTEQSEAITNMMSSIITQTSQSLELKFKEAQEYTDTVGGDLSTYKKEIESFIRNTSAGIEIGEVGNPYSCLLAKDRLEFRDGGSVVAYISNSKLYITHLEVTGSAIIVGVEQKRRSNGNIIWRIRSGG